ncbi:MAG: glycosyltransferase [Romboutsia sp.]
MQNGKIPKIIHYCWFGNGELDKLALKCIDSWNEKLPGYQIKLWNESNFDINSNQFVKEAYDNKKWAFVSDYVRLWAVYHEGGIYMDTDVEVIRTFDDLLDHNVFLGFENKYTVSIGTFGAIKNSEWIGGLLKEYEGKSFYNNDDYKYLAPNTKLLTVYSKMSGLKLDGKMQILDNSIFIYPKDYFIAKSYISDELEVTDKTYCIHHYSASWIKNKNSMKSRIKKYIVRIIGENLYFYITSKKNNL